MLRAALLAGMASFGFAFADDHGEAPRFSMDVVFDLEYASDPQISPDGETIVYVRRSMDIETDRVASHLWVYDLESDEHRPLLEGGSAGSAPRWSPDGSKLAFLSSRDGKPDLKVHLVGSDRTYSLGQLQEGTSAPVWSPDGKRLAFSMLVPDGPQTLISLPSKPEGAQWAEGIRVYEDLTFRADGAGYLRPGERHVFVVPVEGGTPRQVSKVPGGLSGPQWLDDETLLGTGNADEDRDLQALVSRVYKLPLDGGEAEALTGADGSAGGVQVGPGGRIAYTFTPDGKKTYQQTELYVMRADGSGKKNLTEDYDRSVGSVRWRGRDSFYALAEDRGLVRLVTISSGGDVSTLTDEVGNEGTGRPYSSGSYSVSKDGEIAFTRRVMNRPADLALLEGRKVEQLTSLNEDALGHLAMPEMMKVSVPSSVGDFEIDAWIALPPGFEKDGSAPLLLEIHGGPHTMYGGFFSAEVQRFAAEGYVTVWTNPRGSTGYGAEFAQAIDLAYPGKDYDDLISVVDHMVEDGYVSEDRLFVTGGSGGGVLTAWIVGNTDRFAAAASIKPVINWTSEVLSADLAAFGAFEWLKEMPWENQELYWELSPLSKVGNVTTPTMLMAGTDDWRTPKWEAEQFYTALKLQGVDTMMIHVPGASHYIAARPSQLLAKTEAIMAWFERYDPEKQDAE
ncbi:S9 family peptidase [Parvularcula sp. ZS-1/3]|uniref:S9 family peptidase n=1 Tax=Parvularcula mediterranea TaxID=2732508 RepID=A0A7Y3W5B2_9PROT|nr:S9 family peptidase [Parvularcula mediterranea]NNU16086.1 S9 family peptidase [Parvularcula mediterranea]